MLRSTLCDPSQSFTSVVTVVEKGNSWAFSGISVEVSVAFFVLLQIIPWPMWMIMRRNIWQHNRNCVMTSWNTFRNLEICICVSSKFWWYSFYSYSVCISCVMQHISGVAVVGITGAFFATFFYGFRYCWFCHQEFAWRQWKNLWRKTWCKV